MTKFKEGDKVLLTEEGMFVASCQFKKGVREAIDRNTIYQVSDHFIDGRLLIEVFIDVKGVFMKDTGYVLDHMAVKHETINVDSKGSTKDFSIGIKFPKLG